MNIKVGFHGGHSLYELGSINDMVLFFKCLEESIGFVGGGAEWELLGDRLYRKYLRIEELGIAQILMDRAELAFAKIPVEDKGANSDNLEISNYHEHFYKYFDAFGKARLSALSFNESFGIYKPLRIVRSDIPAFIVDKIRPLEAYDSLSKADIPFWAREVSAP